MGVQTEVHLDCVGRMDVLAGPTGRRRWPDDLKCRLVAESMVEGACVVDVARRYGLSANHLSTWRGMARRGELVPSGAVPALMGRDFAPVVINDEEPRDCLASPFAPVELETGGVTVRLDAGTDVQRVAALVLALKDAP
jgi:transposase